MSEGARLMIRKRDWAQVCAARFVVATALLEYAPEVALYPGTPASVEVKTPSSMLFFGEPTQAGVATVDSRACDLH